jgi:hypothetical protein
LATLFGLACSAEDDSVFSGGAGESKPKATLLEDVMASADARAEVTAAATATYLIQVSAGVAEICSGEVTAEIMSNMTFHFPNGSLQCASAEIDLVKVLGGAGGLGDGDGQGGPLGDAIQHDGKVLLVEEIAGARFDPPRPLLVGPIVQDAAKYEGYKETFASSVDGTTPDGTPVSGSGAFEVEVLDTKTTYKNKYVDSFTNVMHWRMTKSGFDGVPMATGMLLESMEFYWNTRPLMIPLVIINADISDAVSGSARDLVGVLNVRLTVKSYDFDGE